MPNIRIRQTADAACFSATFEEARSRFVDAARAAGAQHGSYPLEGAHAPALTIDVATLGPETAPALVVSSGIHGVEGYFGSALQLALLQRLAHGGPPPAVRYVLIHAVNPYGFAHGRRANEDNVDLNRNFMLDVKRYSGAPAGYALLDELLNPRSPPSRLEPFALKAAWNILRAGMGPLKESVAAGQYEYARGLFFGGTAACASTRIVQHNCDAWLALAPRTLHIDLHTGLGAHGKPKLLVNESSGAPHYAWYIRTFGAHIVEPLAQPGGTAYNASGVFGQWMQHHFRAHHYRFVGAEFGTYGVIRVLAAMRAENRAHHYCTPDDPAFARAKRELRECFCPASRAWRRQVLQTALKLVDSGVSALQQHPEANRGMR